MTSRFYQLGKGKSWKIWIKKHSNNNEILFRIFIRLGNQPTNIDPNDIDIIVKYIYYCYGLDTSSGTSFEALCLSQLLNTPNICLRALVPSVPAIEQHVKRACIQDRCLWKLNWNWICLIQHLGAGSCLQHQHFLTFFYGKVVFRLMSILF